jgi:hypothetical protein
MEIWMMRWVAGFFVLFVLAIVVGLGYLATISFGVWAVPVIVALIAVPCLIGWAGDWIFDYKENHK